MSRFASSSAAAGVTRTPRSRRSSPPRCISASLRPNTRAGNVVATIGSALYSNGINIDNIAAPADHATREALAVLKTNKPVSDELLNKIAEEIDAISAFSLNL